MDLEDLPLPRFSRDLLEVLGGRFLAEGEPQGGSPRVREDPLGTPPSLSAKNVLREPREGPENLGSRRSRRSKIMSPSNNPEDQCTSRGGTCPTVGHVMTLPMFVSDRKRYESDTRAMCERHVFFLFCFTYLIAHHLSIVSIAQ